MYNSQNLPLSPKKVFKKSLLPVLATLSTSFFIGVMVYLMSDGTNNLAYAMLWALLFDLIVISAIVGYQYLYYKFYYYSFEEDNAEIKKGVVAVATGHVRYEKIQNIYLDQDILDSIFGLYDVHYETAGEMSRFYSHVDGLNRENSEILVSFLNEKVSGGNANATQLSSKAANEEVIGQEITDNMPVYTRDEIPLEKRYILSMFITGSFGLFFVAAVFIYASLNPTQGQDAGDGIAYNIYAILMPLVILGLFIFVKVWFKNFYFKFDSQGGIIRSRVFVEKSTYIYYNRIQNVNVSQNVIDRILKLKQVKIETAAESTKSASIVIPGLNEENAELLRTFLIEKSRKYQSV
jgi:uncharacterized membrane protein YdbT with pleckstrin-like domain